MLQQSDIRIKASSPPQQHMQNINITTNIETIPQQNKNQMILDDVFNLSRNGRIQIGSIGAPSFTVKYNTRAHPTINTEDVEQQQEDGVVSHRDSQENRSNLLIQQEGGGNGIADLLRKRLLYGGHPNKGSPKSQGQSKRSRHHHHRKQPFQTKTETQIIKGDMVLVMKTDNGTYKKFNAQENHAMHTMHQYHTNTTKGGSVSPRFHDTFQPFAQNGSLFMRQTPATASLQNTSRNYKRNSNPAATVDGGVWKTMSQNEQKYNQQPYSTNGKRLIGTGIGGRRIAALGKVKEGSVLSGGTIKSNNINQHHSSPRGGKKRGVRSKTENNNPFLIQNITLKNKYAVTDNHTVDDDFVLNSFERLWKNVNEEKSPINIDASNGGNTLNISPTKQTGFESLDTITPLDSHLQQREQGETYRKLISLTQKSIEDQDYDGEQLQQQQQIMKPLSIKNNEHKNKTSQQSRVPPINVNFLKQQSLKQARASQPNQGSISTENKANTQETFQLSARQNYQISQRMGATTGDVEVINSASTAFRNFVKEKTLYLKGIDPLQMIRTPASQMEKLQLQAIMKQKALPSKIRNNIDRQSPTRDNHHHFISTQSKSKRSKTQKIVKDQQRGSPRKENSKFDEKRASLKKPILSSKKHDEQLKNQKKQSVYSVENRQQMSTATLFNERQLANASCVSPGRVTKTMTKPNENSRTSNSGSSPNNILGLREKRNSQRLGDQQITNEHQLSIQERISYGNSTIIPGKNVSAHDVLNKSQRIKTDNTTENSIEQVDDKILASVPSGSPTFKQLSEIFAFMDKQDFDQTANEYEQPPVVQVQVADSKQPQRIEVKKRRKTRIGSLPFKTMYVNGFDNSKLGMTLQQHEPRQRTSESKARAISNQAKEIQQKQLDQQRRAISVKPITGDPNNLQNRFFSLRRQRERRNEAMRDIQKEQQSIMYYNIDGWNQTVAPQVTSGTTPNAKKLPEITDQDVSSGSANNIEFQNSWQQLISPPAPQQSSSNLIEHHQNSHKNQQNNNNYTTSHSQGGAETQLGLQADIHQTKNIVQGGVGQQMAETELQILIQQSLMSQPAIKVDKIEVQDNKFGSSEGIITSNDSQEPTMYADLECTLVESCIASETNDLDNRFQILDPISQNNILQKGSQSLIDADHELHATSTIGQIDCEENINNTNNSTKLQQFDPKVKITGVNSEKVTEIDGLTFMDPINQNQYEAQRGVPPPNSPAELNNNTQQMAKKRGSKNVMTPSQLFNYLMSKRQGNELPLIIQQEAQRRQKEFARISKDGRISFVGNDTGNQSSRQNSDNNSNNIDGRISPLQIKVSKPWRTPQETKEFNDIALQQLIKETRERQEIENQKKQDAQQYVIHHDENGTQAMIKIRQLDPKQNSMNKNSTDYDQSQEPRAMTPYNQKYMPNNRNASIKPLLEQTSQRKNGILNLIMNKKQNSCDSNVTEKGASSGRNKQQPSSGHEADMASTHNYFKVKVPLLAISKIRDSHQQDAPKVGISRHQQAAQAQQLQMSGIGQKQWSIGTEVRQTVNLQIQRRDSIGIKQGSFRLKDHRMSNQNAQSASGKDNSDLSFRINSAAQQERANALIGSEIGRHDTLQIFNSSPPIHQVMQDPHSISKETENIEIDTDEFTYSKLIIRDQNGIGKSPMIKQIKYEPVCDRSMKKRKASQKINEEWARLASGSKSQPSRKNGIGTVHQSSNNRPQQTTTSSNTSPMSHIGGDDQNNKIKNVIGEGHRDMGCGANEDILDNIGTSAMDNIQRITPFKDQQQSNATNNPTQIKIQNQTTILKQQDLWRRFPTSSNQQSVSNYPHTSATNMQSIEGPGTAQTVFRVPYPTTKSQLLGLAPVEEAASQTQLDENSQISLCASSTLQVKDYGEGGNIFQRPPSHLNETPRQSEMRDLRHLDLVAKYDD